MFKMQILKIKPTISLILLMQDEVQRLKNCGKFISIIVVQVAKSVGASILWSIAVSRLMYFGTLSIIHRNSGCMVPKCSEHGTG